MHLPMLHHWHVQFICVEIVFLKLDMDTHTNIQTLGEIRCRIRCLAIMVKKKSNLCPTLNVD